MYEPFDRSDDRDGIDAEQGRSVSERADITSSSSDRQRSYLIIEDTKFASHPGDTKKKGKRKFGQRVMTIRSGPATFAHDGRSGSRPDRAGGTR